MGQKILPLSGDELAKWAFQGAFQRHGTDGAVKLGDMETIGFSPTYEESERYSREYPTRTLVRSDVKQKDATFTATLMSITGTALGMIFMDDPDQYVAQAAAAEQTRIIEGVKVGRIYNLGKRDVTITSFDDGENEPVDYVAGTHYRLVPQTGDVEIVAIPAGAASDAVIEFSAAEIVESDGRQELGLMANNGVRGKLTLWGINDIGVSIHVEIWDIEWRPNGEVQIHGSDEYLQLPVTGRVYADPSQPVRFAFGRITIID